MGAFDGEELEGDEVGDATVRSSIKQLHTGDTLRNECYGFKSPEHAIKFGLLLVYSAVVDRPQMEAGTYPVSWLLDTSNALREAIFWNTFGIVPCKLFVLR